MFDLDTTSSTPALTISHDGWRTACRLAAPVTCEIYSTLEALPMWVQAEPLWKDAAHHADGWTLPFQACIPFAGVVVRFNLVYTRRGGAHELSIPMESLRELQPEFGRLMRVDLLPGLADGLPGEDGYLLLPCHAGSLHHFHRDISRCERIALYARQEQWPLRANFNAFGVHRAVSSWFAIVVEGEAEAECVARSHHEAGREYGVHAGLVYRWDGDDPLLAGDRRVRYHLFTPAEGGWAAFARCFRRYLREDRGMQTWEEKRDRTPLLDTFARGMLLKIFMGHKRTRMDGRGEYLSCTSFREARDILEELQADGVERAVAQMVGWNLGGHDGAYPQRFPVNPEEGGEEAFRELIAWGRGHGVAVSVHDNCYDAHEVGENFREEDCVVLRNGKVWKNIPWAGGMTYKICPVRAMPYLADDARRLKALGVEGNFYLDALAAFYPCHAPAHPADRTTFLARTREMLQFSRDLFGTLSVEVPFGPYLDLIDGSYIDEDAAWSDAFSPLGRQWVDQVVPFLPVALHNSVRYHRRDDQLNGRRGALRGLAWGAMPYFETARRRIEEGHAMPLYETLSPYAREAWTLCCHDHVDRVDADLEDIIESGPDLTLTRYADGVELLVNATAEAAVIDGVEIPADSVVRR